MPDKIGGTHMATLVSKPDVVEFIDFLSGEEAESINIESIDFELIPKEIQPSTLANIMAWKSTGVNCIAVKDEYGRFLINPPTDLLLKVGMKMILLGTKLQIAAMKQNVDNV
jgi:voltage-gated potassium channel